MTLAGDSGQQWSIENPSPACGSEKCRWAIN